MKTSERGEIATILTLGVLVVIGVSAMVSSLFLNQKKTTGSQAAVTCDDPKWACGPECASQEVRNVYSQNSDKWRAEAGKIYGGCDKENQPIPPTPSCPGKYDNNGSCNPACCNSDSQCSNGQKCNIPNGFCKSTTSCNPNKEAKFHTTCVGGACVNQACPDTGTCVDDCSSCSGGGATTTSSGGGTTSTAPATDCTPGSGGKNAGKYYCCFAGGKGERKDLNYPHYEEKKDNVENCTGLDMKAGGTTTTTTGNTTGTTTCQSSGGYHIGAGCKNLCSTEPAEADWSCDQGGWCCPPGANSTKPDPSPVPACKEYPSDLECYKNCSKYKEGWSCTGDNSTSCCPGGKDTGNTPPKSVPPKAQTPVIGGSTTENSTRPCTEGDYTIPDSTCGGKPGDFCGLKQRKYELTAGVSCTPKNQTNSKYMCKNDEDFCNSNPQAPKCYEDFKGYCTDKGKCNQGETSNYTSNCGDVDSGRTCCIPPENGTGSYTVWYRAISLSVPHFPVGNNNFSITIMNTQTQKKDTVSFVNVGWDGKNTFTNLPFGTYEVQLSGLPCYGGYSFTGSESQITVSKEGENGPKTLSWTQIKCDQQGSPAQANTATQVKNYTIEVTNMCVSPISSFSLQNAFGVGFVFINTLQKDVPNRVTSSDCNNWGWMTYWINGKSKAYLNTNINGCSSIYSTVRIAGPDMCN